MADERVAEQDTYAVDEVGVRRFIRAGDVVPDGWEVEEGEVAIESEPKPASKPPKKVKKA